MTDITADIPSYMHSSHEVSGPCNDKCGKRGSGCAPCYLICVLSKPLTVPCPGLTSIVVCAVAGSCFASVSSYNQMKLRLRDSAEVFSLLFFFSKFSPLEMSHGVQKK